MSVVREIFILWRNGEIPCLFHLFTGLYCPGCGGPSRRCFWGGRL